MLPLLDLGARTCTHLDSLFITVPDRAASSYPQLDEMHAAWATVHSALERGMHTLTPEAWSQAHASVSQADFEQSPWRNRFSVLLSRSNHLAYHMGQIRLTLSEQSA